MNVNKPFNLPWGASEWIGMNLLSVNEHLIVHTSLNAHGMKIVISGGFHCVTLDLKRIASDMW